MQILKKINILRNNQFKKFSLQSQIFLFKTSTKVHMLANSAILSLAITKKQFFDFICQFQIQVFFFYPNILLLKLGFIQKYRLTHFNKKTKNLNDKDDRNESFSDFWSS